MKRFMLDTSIYNHIIDQNIQLEDLQEGEYFTTYVQHDEIGNTSREDRKADLIQIKNQINATTIPVETFILGVHSHLDFVKLGDGELFEKIKTALDAIEKKDHKADALIAEAACKNGMILVTDDGPLQKVCAKYDIPVTPLDGIRVNPE